MNSKLTKYAVFNDVYEKGNIAGVLTGFTIPNDSELIKIAKMNNLPVLLYIQNDNDIFNVSFYNSQRKMNFCGHGILAASAFLMDNTHSSILHIQGHAYKVHKDYLMYYVAFDSEIKKDPRPDISHYLDRIFKNTISEWKNISVIDNGNKKLFAEVVKQIEFDKLHPNENEIINLSKEFNVNGIYIYKKNSFNKNGLLLEARSFNPLSGKLEDRATGSAVISLMYYYRDKYNRIAVKQGIKGDQCYLESYLDGNGKIMLGGKVLLERKNNNE
ncbi:phenazine biosynthesis-like protein [Leptospira noguchii str. 1993005606]|uniref:Phenazine biosynthesis-like protein n=2 Tax=Leptospira noguchii TaxID=28182 RepID=M6Y579_9LEPT|nr:PhzF family phenazine biosynthesis protein [Leptospira noguchii]EMN00941.1 phenazine biosynthesis-like protein [Leptospira noguchii str. 2007001578]EMO89477.1 phenazine biosynthesis-like protein [Leptospira noguchii str. 2001034031]EPE85895.1 phenazine biosynthesis-like protein [Leptospira noguchii str. 1993005606]